MNTSVRIVLIALKFQTEFVKNSKYNLYTLTYYNAIRHAMVLYPP